MSVRPFFQPRKRGRIIHQVIFNAKHGEMRDAKAKHLPRVRFQIVSDPRVVLLLAQNFAARAVNGIEHHSHRASSLLRTAAIPRSTKAAQGKAIPFP